MPQSAVSLREERSVTDVLNATFLFIRQNIRIYGKMLLLLIAPVFGLGLILATVISTSFDVSAPGNVSPAAGASLALGVAFFLLLLFVVSLAIYTGALTIIRLYDERGPGNFDLEDVWNVGKSKLPGFFGIGFLFGLILVVPMLLVIWIPCLNVIAMLGWFVYVSGTFGLAYSVYVMEDASVGESLSRSKQLVKNYFWPTIGLYLLATLIVTMIGSIAQLPFQVLAFSEGMFSESPSMTSESAVYLAISYVVAILVSTSLGLIPQVAMTFQYTNLVERKENVGLQRRVEQIGDDVDNDAFDESPRVDSNRSDLENPARQSLAEQNSDEQNSVEKQDAASASETSDKGETSDKDETSGSPSSGETSFGGETSSDSESGSSDGANAGDGTGERNDSDEDVRWAPPQRSDETNSKDSDRSSEVESDDPDDRWRPPTS